jgi:hypothetical protein
MKPVLCFLRQMNGFLNDDFGPMRRRIPAASLLYTCRKLSRNHCRIASLNRKGRELSFAAEMTYGMSRNKRLSLGFLMTLMNRGVA